MVRVDPEESDALVEKTAADLISKTSSASEGGDQPPSSSSWAAQPARPLNASTSASCRAEVRSTAASPSWLNIGGCQPYHLVEIERAAPTVRRDRVAFSPGDVGAIAISTERSSTFPGRWCVAYGR
jgi:hypothetical protein